MASPDTRAVVAAVDRQRAATELVASAGAALALAAGFGVPAGGDALLAGAGAIAASAVLGLVVSHTLLVPSAPEGAPRLRGLLALPGLAGLVLAGRTVVLGFALALAGWQRGLPAGGLGGSLLAVVALAALAGADAAVRGEDAVRAAALVEFQRSPEARAGGSAGWTRQRWLLPAVTLATALGMASLAIAVSTGAGAEGLLGAGGAMACVAALAVRASVALGERAHAGSRALAQVVAEVAGGRPRLPDWVSTDENGDVAFALARVGEKLGALAEALQQAGMLLKKSAEQLTRSTGEQGETLTKQMAALQETQVTAQEIRQTSQLTSEKAQEVLALAEKADGIRAAGESVVAQSLEGLEDIGRQVSGMTARIRELGERARQIEAITGSVKDLADQSNMLALNAAIEAVRSGEHGRGFSVVAREMRSLADASIQATRRARDVLEGVREAIDAAVKMSEDGRTRVEAGLGQVRAFGDQLALLTNVVQQNTAAARQIAGAVQQQHAGTSQIFEAVSELSVMMDETLQRVRGSEETTQLVESVALEVSGAVEGFGGGS